VESAAGRFRFGEPGSRDALCALIGAEVASVSVREGDRIALELRGSTLTIPLDHANRVGPEAAHFVPSNADGTPRVADMLIW
jgi:hypothetical protein